MKGLSGKRVEIPSMEEIMQERKRLSYRRRYKRVLKSTAYALVVVAAIGGRGGGAGNEPAAGAAGVG